MISAHALPGEASEHLILYLIKPILAVHLAALLVKLGGVEPE